MGDDFVSSGTPPLSEMETAEQMPELTTSLDEQSSRPTLKSPKDAVQYWNGQYESEKLAGYHFREWWRRAVPRLMSPILSMDYLNPYSHFDEGQIKQDLILPLEMFLCDIEDWSGQTTPETVFSNLSSLNDPPAQCGKLFKMGEPTYSCRDCGHDVTCVLCIECFKNSEHRHHRYKMSTSQGGGYCDCGDAEAWTAHVHCSTHILGTKGHSSDPLSKLPPQIQARARMVFEAVLTYVYEMLTWETTLTLPSDLIYKTDHDPIEIDFSSDGMKLDNYSTVVFNDEVHTFDEVFNALPRAVACDRQVAVGFANLIDREGRCIVKCSGFQHCSEVKQTIERYTGRRGVRPLKVMIMHGHVVAHQTFAIKLLFWLQQILDKSVGFRALFSQILLDKTEPGARSSRLETFLRRDTYLWKSARTQLHHLFGSGMLMENDTKRQFAEIFTRCYGQLIKDFILDDHDHSFSVTSLSVQLFTVPTLAHHLTAHCDVLAILLRTFLSECERKVNTRGKLEFQRNLNFQTFRRTLYILYDLKYLLTTPPKQGVDGEPGCWTNELRKGFLHGVSLLTHVLVLMQGMDAQTRQTTQHVEYELEWEPGFNLHFKLAPIYQNIVQWCATDRTVFIKTVRMIFKKLHEDNAEAFSYRDVKVNEVTTSCLDYQVSSKPISFHQPLTRLLAGLSLHFSKFDLDWDSNAFNIDEKPKPFEMLEPSLRTLVVIAQVQAGMWRRNGYALVDQVRIYHDPKCRREMQDQDVLMLQWSASVCDPDDFLINLLHKFQLANMWSVREFDCSEDDSVRQITTVVEEFLSCVIALVSERYTPGVGKVTAEDNLRNEIIQMLCESPMSHSGLNKALSEDIYKENSMESVVRSVATFKKPNESSSGLAVHNQSGTGVYELKPEFHKEYNVFFYHYSKEEQSRSEEAQRKRKKMAGEAECHPPPLPPPFEDQFAPILGVLKCDTYIYIVSLIMERAYNLKSRCFSENQVHRALHLVGLSLLEEERTADVMEVDGEESKRFDFTRRAEKFDLYNKIEQLVGSQRIESHKDLLDWVLKKWRKVAGMEEVKVEKTERESSPQVQSKSGDSERKRLAAERRKLIMAQMQKAQKSFMKENAVLFTNEETNEDKGPEIGVEELKMEEDVKLKALGNDRTMSATTNTNFTCILCQEEETLTADGKCLVLCSFVQKSTVLSNRKEAILEDDEMLGAAAAPVQKHVPPIRPDLLPADLYCVPHISSCGHVMHSKCYEHFYEDLLSAELRRSRMRQPQSYDIERQEFLCPMCRCLSNSVIPLIPQIQVTSGHVDISFDEWINALSIATKYQKEISPDDRKKDQEEDEEDIITGPLYYTCPLDQVLQELPKESSTAFSRLHDDQDHELVFSTDIFKMMNNFSKAICQVGYGYRLNLKDERIPMATWQSAAFTLHSIVWSCLDSGKKSVLNDNDMSVRHIECLSAIMRFCGIVGTNFVEYKVIRSHSLKILSILLDVLPSNLSILEYDAVGLLVSLTYSLPSLFNRDYAAPLPSGNIQDQHILKLIYILHLVQILLTTDRFSNPEKQEDKESEKPILTFLQIIREAVGFASEVDGREGLTAAAVWNDLKNASLPFLRCAALFYHHLTNVPGPEDLCHLAGDEFEVLTRYLSLPQEPEDLLNMDLVKKLVRNWCAHPRVSHLLKPSAKPNVVTYPLKINNLVPLPHDYSELINSISGFTCPKSTNDDSRVPAMCLICGEVLCSQNYCCQAQIGEKTVGACTAHAETCGGGCGIFFRIRECKVVLLAGRTKGMFILPPYVDQYGETDAGLRRGNPLHLCPDKYRKIYKLWLNHSVPKEISNSLEANPYQMTTPWYQL